MNDHKIGSIIRRFLRRREACEGKRASSQGVSVCAVSVQCYETVILLKDAVKVGCTNPPGER